MFNRRTFLRNSLLAVVLCLLPCRGLARAESQPKIPRDLTFFVVSDTHYGLSPIGDRTIPLLVDKMNALPGAEYPPKIGGTVGKPRGVIHIGDITNAAKKPQWEMFVHDYGLTGSDGRLKYPVYETFGNHDGNSKDPVRIGIRERNPKRVGLTQISDNGLHYSWDWDAVHFVSLGVSVGPTTRPYDPEHSDEFLAKDLAKNVGTTGRPVVLMHHFGFDKAHSLSWWSEQWRTAYFDQIKNFNVIGIFHGHAHEPFIYQWKGIDVFHPPHFRQTGPKDTGSVTHGFFVVHITGDQMTVAQRNLDDTWGMTSIKQLAAK